MLIVLTNLLFQASLKWPPLRAAIPFLLLHQSLTPTPLSSSVPCCCNPPEHSSPNLINPAALSLALCSIAPLQTEASDVDNGHLPGYLKSETMRALWSPVPGSEMSWDREGGYGMGWGVVESRQECGACRRTRSYASHTGGAVGASSVLLVLPAEGTPSAEQGPHLPRGIAVCILCNLQSVGLNAAALQIALEFERCAQK